MDLHRYAAFRRLWRRSPPLQHMVQAYLGIEPVVEEPVEDLAPNALPAPQDEQAAIAQFVAAFAAAGGAVH
jgi:hypothetical protein